MDKLNRAERKLIRNILDNRRALYKTPKRKIAGDNKECKDVTNENFRLMNLGLFTGKQKENMKEEYDLIIPEKLMLKMKVFGILTSIYATETWYELITGIHTRGKGGEHE